MIELLELKTCIIEERYADALAIIGAGMVPNGTIYGRMVFFKSQKTNYK